jgi:hypothetical protein
MLAAAHAGVMFMPVVAALAPFKNKVWRHDECIWLMGNRSFAVHGL